MWYSYENYIVNLSKVDTVYLSGKTLDCYRVIKGKECSKHAYKSFEATELTIFQYTYESDEVALQEFEKIKSILIK